MPAPAPAPPAKPVHAAATAVPVLYCPSVGASAGGSRVIWDFEVSSGWKPFEDDCQFHIEKQYTKFEAGKGQEQILVRTGGIELTLNFAKMTQRLVDSSKTRRIRRRGTE